MRIGVRRQQADCAGIHVFDAVLKSQTQCEEREYLGDSSVASRCMLGHAVQASTLTGVSASPPSDLVILKPSQYLWPALRDLSVPRGSHSCLECAEASRNTGWSRYSLSSLAVSTGVWHLPRRELSGARTCTDSERHSTAHLDRCLQMLVKTLYEANIRKCKMVRQDIHAAVPSGCGRLTS